MTVAKVQKVEEVSPVTTLGNERQKRALQIIIAIGTATGALGIITGQYFAYKTAILTSQKVEQVKTTLVESTAAADGKLDKIHRLVNSAMLIQLHLNMVTTARLAKVTGEKGDAEVAEEARAAYEEHARQQAEINAGSVKRAPTDK